MDDLDEDVPDLVPVDANYKGTTVKQSDVKGPVFEAPKRLEQTVPVTLFTGFLGAIAATVLHCKRQLLCPATSTCVLRRYGWTDDCVLYAVKLHLLQNAWTC